MKRIKSSWVVTGMLLMALGLSRSVFADAQEETLLKNAQTEIDQYASVWSQDEHVNAFAKYFKVPVSAVRDLSAKNQGWGAVTIELAMAWELNTVHPQNFPFMTASLNRIEALRADGKAWGEIARTLEFGLGPVVRETEATSKQLRQDDLALTLKNQEGVKVEENRRIIRLEHQIAQADRADRR